MLGLLIVFWASTAIVLGVSIWQTRVLGRDYQSFQDMYHAYIETDPQTYHKAVQVALPWFQRAGRQPTRLVILYASILALCATVYVFNFGVTLTSPQAIPPGLIFLFTMVTPGVLATAFLSERRMIMNNENANFNFNFEAAGQLTQMSRS